LIAAQRFFCAAAMRFRPAALIFEGAWFLAEADFLAGWAGSVFALWSAQRLRCAAAILSRTAALSFRFIGAFEAGAEVRLKAFGVAIWPSTARASSSLEISASSSATIEAIDIRAFLPQEGYPSRSLQTFIFRKYHFIGRWGEGPIRSGRHRLGQVYDGFADVSGTPSSWRNGAGTSALNRHRTVIGFSTMTRNRQDHNCELLRGRVEV
jgi:hypothetical protein